MGVNFILMSYRVDADRALGLAIAIALAISISSCGKQEGRAEAGAGFQEQALAAGITFRMNNLSREQGERFRINLYDHGAGLAVGDFDNDGRDDIYFLNQHGTNALYHNA